MKILLLVIVLIVIIILLARLSVSIIESIYKIFSNEEPMEYKMGMYYDSKKGSIEATNTPVYDSGKFGKSYDHSNTDISGIENIL